MHYFDPTQKCGSPPHGRWCGYYDTYYGGPMWPPPLVPHRISNVKGWPSLCSNHPGTSNSHNRPATNTNAPTGAHIKMGAMAAWRLLATPIGEMVLNPSDKTTQKYVPVCMAAN
jgi:hypothetical protein